MNEYRKSLQNFKTSKLHKSYPKTSHLSLMLTDAENDVNKKKFKVWHSMGVSWYQKYRPWAVAKFLKISAENFKICRRKFPWDQSPEIFKTVLESEKWLFLATHLISQKSFGRGGVWKCLEKSLQSMLMYFSCI